jgi:hypothetical protein
VRICRDQISTSETEQSEWPLFFLSLVALQANPISLATIDKHSMPTWSILVAITTVSSILNDGGAPSHPNLIITSKHQGYELFGIVHGRN